MTGSAQATIRRLRNGVVPSWEIDRLSVGYDETKRLTNLSLTALELPGRLAPLFVRGEWGTGKTHLLSYVQAAAGRASIVSARVDLNARDSALNYPQRFLCSVAESVKVFECDGMKSLIVQLLESNETRKKLIKFSESPQSGDLGWALADICRRFESGSGFDLADHTIWGLLYGIDLYWSDNQIKRDKAIARIGSVALLCRAVGLKGLVLVLDEAETIDQLWNVRSRISGYSVLERIFKLDAVWCVLGTTMRFDRTIARDLENNILSYDLGSPEAGEFLKRWSKEQYQRYEPPAIDLRNARKLARLIYDVYEAAYGRVKDIDRLIDVCVSDWNRNPSRNPRRLIRLIIHSLDVKRSLKGQVTIA